MMSRRKKLIWQIFPSFLVITVLSLTAVTAYSTKYFKDFFLQNSDRELTIRAKLLQKKFADILEEKEEHHPYIDAQCKDIGAKTGTRVTVVLPSGEVVGDSFGDIASMENHRTRPEIMEALKRNKGVSVRYSSTLDQNMMYIALPVMHDGRVLAVVRTSVSISAIDRKIKSVRNNVLWALVFISVVAAAAGLFVTRRITHPIEQMKEGASEFARGNLQARLAVPDSEELSELAVTMNRMAENLDHRIKDFKDRSMELEAVHSSMLEGVIAIDTEERIITVNAAAAKIFNLKASTLKSRYILEVARNFELQNFIQRALSTHEPVEDDIVIEREENLVLNIHSTALYNAAQERMGTLIIFHDITRIRRLEQMHKDFAANVSHELKTPLTSLKGFIETLQEMMAEQNTDECTKFLGIMDKNVNRMIELINDLLALSKLERMKGTGIRFEPQNIAGLIQGAVNALSAKILKKEITVTIDCPETLTAGVDPILMEQAVINLVDNAVKYSQENSEIRIRVSEQKKSMEWLIQDNGSGIDKEHLPKIFNRFYRVDRGRSRHEGGTGLGLAIVKHIVQYHNGWIDVQSTRGKGSTFRITLPLA